MANIHAKTKKPTHSSMDRFCNCDSIGVLAKTLPTFNSRAALPAELAGQNLKEKNALIHFIRAFITSDSLGVRTQDPILKRDVLYQLS